MSTLEILKQARALISKPENWARSAYARDYMGEAVTSWSPHAVCWSSIGAIRRVSGCSEEGNATIPELYLSIHKKIVAPSRGTPLISISHFNDTHTHAEVLQSFDKTIERLENGV